MQHAPIVPELVVDTGEVVVSAIGSIIRANALGSCVAVTAYDPVARIAGLSHIMLPGKAAEQKKTIKKRYAEDAIKYMLRNMTETGANVSKLQVCLIGGANVLGPGHDSPGSEIVKSVMAILERINIVPVALEVGGVQRRSALVDSRTGMVTYTVGDSGVKVLWSGVPIKDKEDLPREAKRQY